MIETEKLEIEAVKDYGKVQEIGKTKSGESRYFIYINDISKKLGLVKGDKVVISIYKIGHSDQVPRKLKKSASAQVQQEESKDIVQDSKEQGGVQDTREGEGVVEQSDEATSVDPLIQKNKDGTHEVVLEKQESEEKEPEPAKLNEEEQDFKDRYENSPSPQMAGFILKKAQDKWGEDKVKQILEVAE